MQFRHSETGRVVAEPDARNERAIHVFEQCGFEPRREFRFDEAGKDAVLMACERERFRDTATAAPGTGVDDPSEVSADD
jgi:RimJ/RimL family protein N-acetyltransferase